MKPARLRAEHEVGLLRRHPGGQVGDRLPQRRRVGEERRDVLEADARGREVVDLADLRAQVDGAHWAAISRTSRHSSSAASSCASSVSACRSLSAGRAALGVARAQRRRDELLEQRRLAVGRRPERAQVPRVDAEPRQLRADGRDVGVGLGVALVGAAAERREQPVVLELLARTRAGSPARRQSSSKSIASTALAERRPAGAACARSHPGAASSSRITRSGRNSSRWSRRIVTQALDVALAEQPVAAPRPLRAQQPLVLEEADLRDRDVRELVAQAPHDLADPDQALALLRAAACCCVAARHRSTKVSRYLPIWSSSPFSSRALSMRLRFTNVPLSEPWSST